jgi:hypothetical protein
MEPAELEEIIEGLKKCHCVEDTYTVFAYRCESVEDWMNHTPDTDPYLKRVKAEINRIIEEVKTKNAANKEAGQVS